ncbi:MAG TPA: hypothetical protein VGV92_05640 [Gammaproteobacteria bacterium]|nr:hypothetical protein [Gammaproteobacteria bacterium]
MWKAINYGCAVSEDGVRIKVGRTYISYADGDYAIRIDRAVISKDPYVSTIDFSRMDEWFPPHQSEVISAEQKKKIIQSVTEAMVVLGDEDKLNDHEVSFKDGKLFITLTRKNYFEIYGENKRFLEGIKNKLSNI